MPRTDEEKIDAALTEIEEARLLAPFRKQIDRLQRKLVSVETNHRELARAFREGAAEGSRGLVIPPVPPPPKDNRGGAELTALLISTDWQLGKRTRSYNTKICEQRICESMVPKVNALIRTMKNSYPVRKLVVGWNGDINEGELIFPGQHWHIDSSMLRQMAVDGPRIGMRMFRGLLPEVEEIEVHCVNGNHGRTAGRESRDLHPETNSDAVLYQIVADRFIEAGEKRIRFHLPHERPDPWCAQPRVGKWRLFMFHGHQIKGGGGWSNLPLGGFYKAIAKWASGSLPKGIDYAFSGHWHSANRLSINDVTLWVSGSPESGNSWCQEELKGSPGRPSQWLFFIHPEHGIIGEHEIRL